MKLIQKFTLYYLSLNIFDRNKKMANLIKSANLFPYTDLWRVRGDPDVNHICGGMSSIVLFLLIIAICLAKLVQVFRMTTVFATQTTINDLIPPKINITTFQNDPTLNPFMLGFSLSTGYKATSPSFSPSDIKVIAVYYQEQNSGNINPTAKQTLIDLEPCTVEHFSSVPNVNKSFQVWGFDRFTCIQLNQTYQIGGQRGFNNQYKSLQLKFECANSDCRTSTSKSLIFTIITLDTFANPTNASIPELTYTTPFTVSFQSNTYNQYNIRLDSNEVNTDSSIFPFEKVSTHNSVKAQGKAQTLILSNDDAITTIWIQKSNVRTTYDRTFLKLLDAVAYAGGIFQSLLGIFFFMGGFGRLIYQMDLAYKLFNNKDTKNIGFITYLKHSVFGILESMGSKPNWQQVETQQQYQKTVNNLIDVVYLQKRIIFLQRAIELLIQKHQLKGLHLVEGYNKTEINNHRKYHSFRKILLRYFFTNIKNRQYNHHQSLFRSERHHQLFNQQTKQTNRVEKHTGFKDIILLTNNKVRETNRDRKSTSQPQKDYGYGLSDAQLRNRDQMTQSRPDYLVLQAEAEEMSEEEDNDMEYDSIKQMIPELKMVVDEAERQNGDPRSQKIKEMIGIQLWSLLKGTIREAQMNELNDVDPLAGR